MTVAMSRRTRSSISASALLAVTLLVVAFTTSTTATAADTPATLTGTVLAAGTPVEGAAVSVHRAGNFGSEVLATGTTDATGTFHLEYGAPDEGIVYAVSSGGVPASDPDPATSPVRLLTVVGVHGDRAGAAPFSFDDVIINELTTAGSTYALAQFLQGSTGSRVDIWGPSPGLENAAATALNLIDPSDGGLGDVVTNADNGASNETLATLNTLANLVAGCTTSITGIECHELLTLTTLTGMPSPTNTVQAMRSLVLDPLLSRIELHALAQLSTTYQPDLDLPPEYWLLALHYTGSGMGAPGRMAFDSKGNLWTNNNWLPNTTDSSPFVTALDPTGKPRLGSPLTGGGVDGSGWGMDIDAEGNIWLANFGGNSVSKFAPDGTPLSPSTGWTDGDLDHPQGLDVDAAGNVWIANNTGTNPDVHAGSVTVYPGGDHTKALVITGGGIMHPFSVQVDDQGRAWVTNAGPAGSSVTVIEPDFTFADFSPIDLPGSGSPHGLAFDSKGNAWVASFEGSNVSLIHPDGTLAPGSPFDIGPPVENWGIAVDGLDRVWVAGFALQGIWLLCGTNLDACPPGSQTGDVLSTAPLGYRNASLQHVTAVQVDTAGNVWAANNWSSIAPPDAGDGLVQFIGIAAPVCTPMGPLVEAPARGTATPCTSFTPQPRPQPDDGPQVTPRFTG